MIWMKRAGLAAVTAATMSCALLTQTATATETEHLGFSVLPAPGKVVIDGKFNDWDLTGGVFACGDVENMREKMGVWFYAMYDDENLYLLARVVDDSPMNNPGQTVADYGFAGDSMQIRWIADVGTPKERGGHITAWHGRDDRDVINIEQGKDFKEPVIKDAKELGAQQAFMKNADGAGYVQEIAMPWKLITRDGRALKAGEQVQLTIEPNFTVGGRGRMTIKDIFKPGITLDRVFTFMNAPEWGTATLEKKGNLPLRPVRLSDKREFVVKMEKGLPVVDWTGLIKTRELPGFKKIAYEVPADGYISLNIRNADGVVVRQLLNSAFVTKGKHETKWDGLTNLSVTVPGEPVAAGAYTWDALWNPGIGLRLRGWADNGGSAPWDGPTGKENWGGDHGTPNSAAADSKQVYLGWTGAEAGKAVVATDLNGSVIWANNRAGIAGVSALAADDGVVYILGGAAGPDSEGGAMYRLVAADGSYLPFTANEANLHMASLWPDPKGKSDKAQGIAAKAGKMYFSFAKDNAVMVVDAKSGKLQKIVAVESPTALFAASDTLLYAVSGGKSVVAINPGSGEVKPVVSGLSDIGGVTADKDGKIYVALREPDQQVRVYGADGKELGAIGKKGGRALLGKWEQEGMRYVRGLAVDAAGKLWVAEDDGCPKRVSVWDTKSSRFVKEFFGGSSYGALGGAILGSDPDVMVGQGCEWRLDAKTGLGTCTSIITREGMENSRFAVGANGKTYLAVAHGWAFAEAPVDIFERVGEGQYKLRARFDYEGKEAKEKKTLYWADENGDEKRQESEVTTLPGSVRFSAWYMKLSPDLTFATENTLVRCNGFTGCGAPKFDFEHPTKIAPYGCPSADNTMVLAGGEYNTDHGVMRCFDVASGKMLWSYPDNFVGVHGSHNACQPTVGMVRGSFNSTGSVKLPEPIGNVWVLPTNVGEWHIMTEHGFYLTRLFEGDWLKIRWPEMAVPGAVMDAVPPGMGGEDFGGSVTLGKDGKVYVQAGKTAFWNLEVVGLDKVKAIKGGSITLSADEVAKARAGREQQLQEAVGTPSMQVVKLTPKFTGNVENDFKGADLVHFKKIDDARVYNAAAAWDEQSLYLAWDVADNTPWVNGAEDVESMYLYGDTVDLQLGVDPKADAKRDKPVLGDLRLSIGNFKGKPTAVLYRPVAADKHPKDFSSGVIKKYTVESVEVLSDAKIEVKVEGGRYKVEAAIPLSVLGLKPADGLKLHGDLGVTHGDTAGKRTRLRTYWSNQHTGIVDDAVFELMMEPKNWGELLFK
jgi:hypothetical protein